MKKNRPKTVNQAQKNKDVPQYLVYRPKITDKKKNWQAALDRLSPKYWRAR